LVLVCVIGLLLAATLIPFVLWGEEMERWLSIDGARAWMNSFGAGAGIAGVALLVADVALPVPSTIVMSALGLTYGAWIGGLYASLGSILAGLLAYGLCRALGRPMALRIAGADGLRSGEAFFARGGPWLVLLSRWMPVLPEAVACLAGLVKMPFRGYCLALVCGSVPMGFAFAGIGALGQERPDWAIALSIVVPVVCWLAARKWLPKGTTADHPPTSSPRDGWTPSP
jgi:uncharacterized membrane protein YdjX (TVP38/TMEM64 family)